MAVHEATRTATSEVHLRGANGPLAASSPGQMGLKVSGHELCWVWRRVPSPDSRPASAAHWPLPPCPPRPTDFVCTSVVASALLLHLTALQSAEIKLRSRSTAKPKSDKSMKVHIGTHPEESGLAELNTLRVWDIGDDMPAGRRGGDRGDGKTRGEPREEP